MTRIISRVYLDFHATAGIKLRILPHISYQYRVVLLLVDHKAPNSCELLFASEQEMVLAEISWKSSLLSLLSRQPW